MISVQRAENTRKYVWYMVISCPWFLKACSTLLSSLDVGSTPRR